MTEHYESTTRRRELRAGCRAWVHREVHRIGLLVMRSHSHPDPRQRRAAELAARLALQNVRSLDTFWRAR